MCMKVPLHLRLRLHPQRKFQDKVALLPSQQWPCQSQMTCATLLKFKTKLTKIGENKVQAIFTHH